MTPKFRVDRQRPRQRIRWIALALPWVLSLAFSPALSTREIGRSITGTVSSYTVRAGDSFVSIAARFGVEVATLAGDNQIRAGALPHPDQVLQVDNRHIAPAIAGDGIVINIPQRMLFLLRGGEIAAAYPVAVGKPDWRSPIGTYTIATLEVDPTWDVPVSIQREMARAGRRVLTKVPPGPENPLGDRWIGLESAGIGIHGTNQPASVFRFTTHGCIRLHGDDARRLFELVTLGLPVTLVYEPVLFAVDREGRVWLEVQRDPYRQSGDLHRVARGLLESAGLESRVDAAAVRRCAQERRGRLCDVSR